MKTASEVLISATTKHRHLKVLHMNSTNSNASFHTPRNSIIFIGGLNGLGGNGQRQYHDSKQKRLLIQSKRNGIGSLSSYEQFRCMYTIFVYMDCKK